MAERAVEIFRGEWVESVAYADVAVVDSLGRLIAWAGDPEQSTFWRSSAKPFQTMPVIMAGAVAKFGLSAEDVAILTSSHGGEVRHVERVEALLAKIGASPEELACGIHWPSTLSSREALVEAGKQPTVLHNNCSGKHTGMVMLSRLLGVVSAGYLASEHPVQVQILENVRRMTGLSAQDPIPTATDGCGVPTFYLPLTRMAVAYAQLVDPRGLEADQAIAAQMVAEAIRTYPELVSGQGRLEVELAQATGGRLVTKGGAEALFTIGVPERGWGIAVKMADGNPRTLASTVIASLIQLDLLDDETIHALHEVIFPTLKNHAGTEVGGMRAVLPLHRARISVRPRIR